MDTDAFAGIGGTVIDAVVGFMLDDGSAGATTI